MIELIIAPESVRVSKTKLSTQIFSEIYFKIDDGTFFPEEGWDDFSVVILGWWLYQAAFNVPQESIFRFMDGPYCFKLCSDESCSHILFIKDVGGEGEVVCYGALRRDEFMSLLLRSANLLIRSLPKESRGLEEVLELERNFKLLQKACGSA